MADYVPTTADVRRDYGSARPTYGGSAEQGAMRVIHREMAFERWLADHDRGVAERTLREAAVALRNEADKIANQDGGVSDEDISFTDGVYASASAVSDRADRLAIKETRHD